MTEIRNTDGTVDRASVRLRALEIVTQTWGDNIGHQEALGMAKGLTAWIADGALDLAAAPEEARAQIAARDQAILDHLDRAARNQKHIEGLEAQLASWHAVVIAARAWVEFPTTLGSTAVALRAAVLGTEPEPIEEKP